MKKKGLSKKGIATETLIAILIAVAVLVIVGITAFFLRKSGFSLIDKIKVLFGGR